MKSLSLFKRSLIMAMLMKVMALSIFITKNLVVQRIILMANLNLKDRIIRRHFKKPRELLHKKVRRKAKRIRETLLFGKIQSQVNLIGTHHGEEVDLDGILSAQQWYTPYLKSIQLTFILEEKT